ncbi:MAG: hypothetical protein PHY39_00640 [Endomicrobiaceae bacterium]|nr:hypothetical protein [Endomicrobiaceae bacterium]
MSGKESLNVENFQDNIDKPKILKEVKEYSENQMKVLKQKKTDSLVYIFMCIILVTIIISVYLFFIHGILKGV